MKIADIKDGLRDARVQAVIAQSVYMPTAEKLDRLMGSYEADAGIYAFAGVENSLACCVLILKRKSGGEFEILRIATDPAHRGRGLASRLISFAESVLHCESITAETDGDAVGFYRKCGFRIESQGERYPGVIRYLCTRGGSGAALSQPEPRESVTIRKASIGNAPALGGVYRRSWQAAYGNLLPDAFLGALTDESCAPRSIDPACNLVAERDGVVTGVASFGPARDAEFEDWGELRAIYVLPDA